MLVSDEVSNRDTTISKIKISGDNQALEDESKQQSYHKLLNHN